ncbi:hypothetical protein GA0115245_10324 [Streptomyces sp. di188]|nr:hypothetical protein GA0115245_10324 [Streptomyces sp. di188]SCD44891.1 hypothetical protein GA0115238_10954 [Streptomyces sp. di50b]
MSDTTIEQMPGSEPAAAVPASGRAGDRDARGRARSEARRLTGEGGLLQQLTGPGVRPGERDHRSPRMREARRRGLEQRQLPQRNAGEDGTDRRRPGRGHGPPGCGGHVRAGPRQEAPVTPPPRSRCTGGTATSPRRSSNRSGTWRSCCATPWTHGSLTASSTGAGPRSGTSTGRSLSVARPAATSPRPTSASAGRCCDHAAREGHRGAELRLLALPAGPPVQDQPVARPRGLLPPRPPPCPGHGGGAGQTAAQVP